MSSGNFEDRHGQSDRRLYVPIYKITIPLILLLGTITLTYITGSSDKFILVFAELQNYEIWRMFLSFLSSRSFFGFLFNLGAVVLMTFISERIVGSIYYSVDLLIKNFLINLFILLAYIILLCCAVVFDAPVNEFIREQTDSPTHGMMPLLTLQIVQFVLSYLAAAYETLRSNYPAIVTFVLGGLYVLISLTYFRTIWFWASSLLGFLYMVKWVDYGSFLENIGSYKLPGENSYKRITFRPMNEPVPADYYDMNEQQSFEIKKITESTEGSVGKAESDRAELSEEKSRYENVNVNDYKLKPAEEEKTGKEQESFEI